MSISISIDQIRKSNLKKLIDEKGYKSLTEFAKTHGFFTSNLSPILNGNKKFTDKLAQSLEEKLKLPEGFLSRLNTEGDKEYLIPYKTLSNLPDNNITLTDEGSCFSISKAIIDEDKFDPSNLFAINGSFTGIDRNAMTNSLQKNSVLIFNSNDKRILNNKIYLIKFSNQLLIREYLENNNTGFFETENPALYAKISAPSKDVEIIGRLVYQLNIEKF